MIPKFRSVLKELNISSVISVCNAPSLTFIPIKNSVKRQCLICELCFKWRQAFLILNFGELLLTSGINTKDNIICIKDINNIIIAVNT